MNNNKEEEVFMLLMKKAVGDPSGFLNYY